VAYLIVDFGTSSCRAVFVDEEGVCRQEQRTPVKVRRNGACAEIDPDEAWTAVQTVLRGLTEVVSASEVEAVGISTLLAYLYLDAEDRAIGSAAIWMDFRAEREARELSLDFSPELIHQRTGRRVSPELLAPRLRWLRKNEPDKFRQVHRVIGLKDELVRRLTGVIATDYSHMNYSMLYDHVSRKPLEDFVEWSGLKSPPLPDPVPAQQIIGRVSRRAAELTGLREGVPVICGTTDGTAAMYGGGMLVPGTAVLVSGTTDVLMSLTKRPVSESGRVLSINTGMVPETCAVGGAMGMAGGSLQHIADLFKLSVPELIREAETIPAGAEGLYMLPGFSGERSPYWKSYMTGGLLGLTMNHRPGHIARALLESTAFRIRKLLQVMHDSGVSMDTLNVVGGGSTVEIWNRIRGDVCGIPLTVPREIEATVLGTALFCRLGSDPAADPVEISRRWVVPERVYHPDMQEAARYAERFSLFEKYIVGTDKVYRELSQKMEQET